MANNTSLLHLKNSALAEASFLESKQNALAKTRGPGNVRRSWNTQCLGVEAEKPSQERTLGYSEGSFRISLGTVWKRAQNGSEAEGEGTAERTSRESASRTQTLATSTNKAWCRKKLEPSMGTETGASWKNQEK